MEQQTEKGCALTGHRTLGKDFSVEKLKTVLSDLVEKENITSFYCGMAMGFDLTACEILLKMKESNPSLKVVACIPCPEQAKYYPPHIGEKYRQLVALCDERVVLSPQYTVACMHIRNHYMVNHARFLVAYCTRDKGGTAYTVRYAIKNGVPIIYV